MADTSVAARLSEVRERIRSAASAAGRDPKTVKLLAVSKKQPTRAIREAYAEGQRDFGESYAQELATKAEELRSLTEIRWHMIGHLQRNKARKVVDCVRLIQSVDSLRLAEELQQILRKGERRIDVLLQVNVSGEDAKSGCLLPAVPAMVDQLDSMYNLRLRGLMTMAPFSENPEDARPHFARCRELFEEIRSSGVGEGAFNLLSMGMSGDFEVGIEEGANIVRVGSAIFGNNGASEPETEGD